MTEFTYTRVHRGSPELLFACMTEPEHLTRFWGPAGTTTPVGQIVVDLRPGGAFETTMVNDADGSAYTMRAVYAEISRPGRLVWLDGDMRTTVTFNDLGDGRTEVVTHQADTPAGFRSEGFASSLDRFGAYIAGLSVVTSPDGTRIAYERSGSGPALVLIDGAMCHRAAGPMRPLAALLQDRFTVYTYDRRGRGQSTDTLPYAVEREVEDLQAVIDVAGGSAYVYGMSSGSALALRAADATKLALYEPPFLPGTSAKEYSAQLAEALQAGRGADAVALFMTHVGVPPQVVAGIRTQPHFAALEAIAPTLAYDDQLLGDSDVPRHLPVKVPMLVISGTATPPALTQAARSTAEAFPTASHRTLEGQTHDVQPAALAPLLIDFFR